MKVKIEDIRAMQDVRAKINNIALCEIEFYEDGKRVEIDEEIIDDFELTGLSNIDFIVSDYYLIPIYYPCGCRVSEEKEIKGKMQCNCGFRR